MGPQILWARLEVLGPEDDVQEKEGERKKKKVFFISFFVSLPSMIYLLGHGTRFLCPDREYKLLTYRDYIYAWNIPPRLLLLLLTF